ncbi:MAG: lasso peptide biosynthesis B2 protein [SAR86 cluster bacterium]|nr:lasso peptide biosynthesis B2 protein [SAR86 cluster bacterium]
MNKIYFYLIIFISLAATKIFLKLFGLKKTIESINKRPIFLKILGKIDNIKIARAVEKFYRLKLFLCLESSILIKRTYYDDKEVKVHIGVRNLEESFMSHAWVLKGNKIIFGKIKDIDNYKIIHSV